MAPKPRTPRRATRETASSGRTLTSTPPNAPTATNTPLPPTATNTATPSSGHAIKTVFLIVMENHNWSSIKGSSSAPYVNNTLLPMASHAEQYYNPPSRHPSLGNYLWLEGGQCFTYCGTDNDPSASPGGISSSQHLVMLLNNAGISWKAYQEGITDGTCPLSSSYPYAPKHNAFVYFNDVNGSSAYCTAHERSYADLSGDLGSSTTTARYNFITPDLCHDGHDSCSPLNNPVAQTDQWLQANLPAILGSQAYKNGGAVFITWDEGENGSDGPIGMIVLSPYARGGGYFNTIHYTHSSTLRTLEEIYGVSPLLGDAANATDLRDLFSTFP